MDLAPKHARPIPEPPIQAASGDFAGWWSWPNDHYEAHSGPFWHRVEADGNVRCAFRIEQKHINGSGSVHGGCLMTFADYCLFALCGPTLGYGHGVTLSFACEFIDAARLGELVEGTGEVIRTGRSVVFVRGLLSSGSRPLLNFSGTIKRTGQPRS